MRTNREGLAAIIEGAVLGSSAATVAGCIGALLAFLSGEIFALRMCLTAAAASFWLLANAVFFGVRLSNEKSHNGQVRHRPRTASLSGGETDGTRQR
jgi:hypothetical protein